MVVFEKGGCLRAKVVVIGQKWSYSDKLIDFRQKCFLFEQKWFYSGNKVVFGFKF